MSKGAKGEESILWSKQGIVSGEDKNFVYLGPCILAQVKMRNWTKSGLLRSPVSRDLRMLTNSRKKKREAV